nr:hypothetical protein [bacterium]
TSAISAFSGVEHEKAKTVKMFKIAIIFLMTLSIRSVDKKPGYIFRLNDFFCLFVLSHEEEQIA